MKRPYILLMLTLFIGSCQVDDATDEDKPVISKEYYQRQPEPPVVRTLTVTPTLLSYEAAEEEKSLHVSSSNTEWQIAAPDWCVVSQSSGTGDADISVKATANTSREQRTGQITISGTGIATVYISVTQKGRDVSNEPDEGDNLPPQ